MIIFIQTISGVVSYFAGISLLYFFISRLSTNVNYIFLITSLIFLASGTYLFIRVSKFTNSVSDESKAVEVVPADGGSKLLEKNNQMVKEWNHTTNKKDNLKAVQIAVSAEATAVAEENK